MKALVHLVPRSPGSDALEAQIAWLAAELRPEAFDRGVAVHTLQHLPQDPFGRDAPFRGAIELSGANAPAATLEALLARLGSRVADVALPEQCTALVGTDEVVVASSRAPVRYQYLMRRNAHYDHAGYLKRYRDVHADFGVRVPGKLGYVQFHVDPLASRRAADAAGLGVCDFDSVTELHLDSLDRFLAEVSRWSDGRAAIADEEVFVDRPRSMAFCSRVDWAPEAAAGG